MKQLRAEERARQQDIAGREFRVEVFESVGPYLIQVIHESVDWAQMGESQRAIGSAHMDLIYYMVCNLLAIGLKMDRAAAGAR